MDDIFGSGSRKSNSEVILDVLRRMSESSSIQNIDPALVEYSAGGLPTGSESRYISFADFHNNVIYNDLFGAQKTALERVKGSTYSPGTRLIDYIADLGRQLGASPIVKTSEDAEGIITTDKIQLGTRGRGFRHEILVGGQTLGSGDAGRANVIKGLRQIANRFSQHRVIKHPAGIPYLERLGFPLSSGSIDGIGDPAFVIDAGKTKTPKYNPRMLMRARAKRYLRGEAMSRALDVIGDIDLLEQTLTSGQLPSSVRDRMGAVLGKSRKDMAMVTRRFNRALLGANTAPGLLGYLRTFRASVEGMGQTRNIQSLWRQFMRPVISGMSSMAQSPYSAFHGPRMPAIEGIDAVQSGRGFTLRRGALGQEIQESLATGLGNDQELRGLFAANFDASKSVNDIQIRTKSIRKILSILDSREAEIATGLAHHRIPTNRVATFDRLTWTLKEVLAGINKDSDTQYKANFEFIRGHRELFSGSNIRITLMPQNMGSIARGAEVSNVLQFSLPVPDVQGIFTTNGNKYVGLPTPISHQVEKSAMYALWDPRLSLVSKSIYPISSFTGTARNKLSPEQAAAIASRNKGTFDVYSAFEMLGAHIDNAIRYAQRNIVSGNFSAATKSLSMAFKDFFHGTYGFAQNITNKSPQQVALLRTMMNVKEYLMFHPFDLFNRQFGAPMDDDIMRNILTGNYGNLGMKIDQNAMMRFDSLRAKMMPQWRAFVENKNAKLSEDLRKSKITDIDVANEIIQQMKFGTGASHYIEQNQQYLQNAAQSLGMLPHSAVEKAINFMSPDIKYLSLPGGMSSVRPVQLFDQSYNLGAPAAGRENAAFEFMKFGQGYGGGGYEDFLSTEHMRYGHVGIVQGATIDGKSMSSTEAMDMLGAREQQIIMNKNFGGAFGEGFNVQGKKFFADYSKGVAHVREDLDILDNSMDMFWGIPIQKIMGKHQSGQMIWRGVLGRILESPLDMAEARSIAGILQDRLGHLNIGFQVAQGMVQATFHKPVIYGGVNATSLSPQLLPEVAGLGDYGVLNMAQLTGVIDEINARRIASGQKTLDLVRQIPVNIRGRSGTVEVLDILSGVRHNVKKEPGMSGGMHEASFDVNVLENMEMLGLRVHAYDMLLNAMHSNDSARNIFQLQDSLKAYYGNTLGGNSDIDFSESVSTQQAYANMAMSEAKVYSAADLAKTGRLDVTGSLSAAEYNRLYPENGAISAVELSDGSRLYIPRQTPMAAGGGEFFPTKQQQALNEVLRQSIATGEGADLEGAVRNFKSILTEEIGGKKALIANSFYRFSVKGKGFSRALLGQDPWGPDSLRVGEAAASPAFASEYLGIGPKDELLFDQERGLPYVYGTVNRYPDIYPRGAMRVYIDKGLGSRAQLFVNNIDMAQLYGDSDGDIIAFYMANAKRLKYDLTEGMKELNRMQFESAIRRRQMEYEYAGVGQAIEEAMAPPMGRITSTATLLSEMEALEGKYPIQSGADIHLQRYDSARGAMGIIGNLIQPFKEVLKGVALNEQYSPEIRQTAQTLEAIFGKPLEEVVKVGKSGVLGKGAVPERFSSARYDAMLKDKDPLSFEEYRGVQIGLPGSHDVSAEGPVEYGSKYFTTGFEAMHEFVANFREAAANEGIDKPYDMFVKLAGGSFEVKRGLGKKAIASFMDMLEGQENGTEELAGGTLNRMMKELLGATLEGPGGEGPNIRMPLGGSPAGELLGAVGAVQAGTNLLGQALKNVAEKTPENFVSETITKKLRNTAQPLIPERTRISENAATFNIRGRLKASPGNMSPDEAIESLNGQIGNVSYDVRDYTNIIGAQSPLIDDITKQFGNG